MTKVAYKSVTETTNYLEPADVAVVMEEHPIAFAEMLIAMCCPERTKDNPLGQRRLDAQRVGAALRVDAKERGRHVGDMLLDIIIALRQG